MAAAWRNLQHKSTAATEYVMKHAGEYYKTLLERNKHYIVEEPTVEKCNELSKQLLYTRLASLPHRAESFWKEVEIVKAKFRNRQELKLEEVGIAALFVGECYAWFCVGGMIGRRSITGYRV
ncbi:hypothetical protein SELMODRAFT_181796 [Selaginella moellendorffii]|uniref:Uncharacterized protein n=1 Tax=Selaginella moellendorffii TaxID=88036 RepID=D8SQC4_SELML|nr:uncharacterized protein LOC9653360 [Selaginella moellendorffii]XP_002987069.1 uncharacterized protein LOC9662798 [Selaginella moellendorffii]EFJ11912.1 hypothetical protein SELMODRAFT_125189 [Selaginella moellendorffii]EFJ13374.1 hypothetical protein SELMODRAFT_181796 [Selaginella moellendorffii]|eukprot:XP_002985500.1 uncharacterized protein LOC9653360 [Selaginella moellendorffii]